MVNILLDRWFQLGVGMAITAVAGVVIGVVIAESETVTSVKDVAGSVATGAFTDDSQFLGPVILTTGASITKCREGAVVSCQDAVSTIDKDILMPLTSVEAIAAGWEDPILCSAGRGRYFQKGDVGYGEPYFLMYDYLDQLIGIYYFSEGEMPHPWEYQEFLKGAGGLVIIDFEHWGLFTYFQDATNACQPPSIEGSGGGKVAEETTAFGENTVKSTPTPVVPPTPTPSAGQVLETVVARTAKVNSLSFTLTGDPEAQKVEGTLGSKGTLSLVREGVVTVTDSAGTTQDVAAESLSFSYEGLGATLSAIAGALQDPVDTKAAFIDNVKRRGVTGTVLGADLSALVPTAVVDARVTVSLWFDDKDRIVRLRLEGAVTPDDPPDAVRVLDLGGFRR